MTASPQAPPAPAKEPLPPVRKWLFRLLALAALAAYGYYSYGGFRVALKGCEYAAAGKRATAQRAFLFVLDRQSYCFAVPLARAHLGDTLDPAAPAAVERLAPSDIEGTVARSVEGLAKLVGDPGRGSAPGAAGGEWFSPLNCDLAPLASLAASLALSVLLTLAFFLRKRASLARRFLGLLVILAALAWVFSDGYFGLRASLLGPAPAPALAMAYDYPKYLIAFILLLATLRQWLYARWRWASAQP